MFEPTATPWQAPSCGPATIMSTLVLAAINSSFVEQRPTPASCVGDEFDFVVVGGGSAGCVVASRLSENPLWSVLLLEAGGEQPEVTRVPGFYNDVSTSSHLNWHWRSQPQDNGPCATGCDISRGKGLGGGSTINGMLYVRGNHHDFDYWNASDWTYEKVLPFFKLSENNRDPAEVNDTQYHSTGGPLSVQRSPYQDPNTGFITDALAELGVPVVDFNGAQQLGQGIFQMTMDGSLRDSTNSAFLDSARRRGRNLRVETQALVTRILFQDEQGASSKPRATGVEYVDSEGVRRTALARKEVVLSGGTFGSPQLLMLSGVGPADHLRNVNLPVVLDLPGVGENLQDHVLVASGVVIQLNETYASVPAGLHQRMDNLLGFEEGLGGPYSSIGLLQYGAFSRSQEHQPADDPRPYIQQGYSGWASSQDEDSDAGGNCSLHSPLLGQSPLYYNLLSIAPILLHPRSRGRVSLDPRDPKGRQPVVEFNLLSDERDIRVLGEALRNAYRLTETDAFRRWGVHLLPPNGDSVPEECRGFAVDDKEDLLWRCLARTSGVTGYHAVGTCAIGTVVDQRLRLSGVDGLRVVDASVIPLSPSGNSNAPTIMVAERGAHMIREDWASQEGAGQ